MKLGFSMYSFSTLGTLKKDFSLEQIFQAIKKVGGEHIEMIDFGPQESAEVIREFSEKYALPVSAYSVGSRLAQTEGDDHKKEMERIMAQVDKAAAMGSPLIRCDLVSVIGNDKTKIEEYDRIFPRMVESAQALADYAAERGLDLTVENHGTLNNGGDRVRKLILAVDRPNYGCTLDIGNSLCVDEDPLICIDALLPFAKRIHVKDFYNRTDAYQIGAKSLDDASVDAEGFNGSCWFPTKHGHYLRGSIVGHGDTNIRAALKMIKESGYDGYMAIEFEGIEEPMMANTIGLTNLKTMLRQL